MKEYPRYTCLVCGGLMQAISPRAPHDIRIHFYCGTKQNAATPQRVDQEVGKN